MTEPWGPDPTGHQPETQEVAWAIFYEDPDHKTELFYGAGSESAARRRFAVARQTWNCTLFRQYAPMGWEEPDAHTRANRVLASSEALRPLLAWAEAMSQHHAMLGTDPPFTTAQKLHDALASAYLVALDQVTSK